MGRMSYIPTTPAHSALGSSMRVTLRAKGHRSTPNMPGTRYIGQSENRAYIIVHRYNMSVVKMCSLDCTSVMKARTDWLASCAMCVHAQVCAHVIYYVCSCSILYICILMFYTMCVHVLYYVCVAEQREGQHQWQPGWPWLLCHTGITKLVFLHCHTGSIRYFMAEPKYP